MSLVQTSIITPFYNRERYLAQAIESVLTQSDPDWELILWNDGSTDSSGEIADGYAAQDARIRVFHAQHQGVGYARLMAHRQARGEYFGWLDSDDLLNPLAIAQTRQILDKNPQAGLVYTYHNICDTQGRLMPMSERGRIPYTPGDLLLDFMTRHFRLMRRSVYFEAGEIDPSYPAAGDYDLCLRLSEITQFECLPLPLYVYRVHADQISTAQAYQHQWAIKAVKSALKRRDLDRYYNLIETPDGHYFERSTLNPLNYAETQKSCSNVFVSTGTSSCT